VEDFNDNNLIYVKVKDVASASGITARALRKRCKNNKYQTRTINGNGGQQYEILFSSLEPEIQEKLKYNYFNTNDYEVRTNKHNVCAFGGAENPKSNYLSSAPFSLTDEEKNIISTFGLDKFKQEKRVIPEIAKKKALYKLDLIIDWQDFRKDFKSKKQADKEYIRLYNSKLRKERLYNHLGKTSLQTLYRWNKLWNDSHYDWKELIDNYSYGSENQLLTTLSDLEKFMLLKFMLHQNKYKLGKAYELITVELKQKGVEEISSYSAYARVWQYVVKNHSDKVEYARGGLKAAIDKELPHITRDFSVLNVGDVIIGDGHTLDFMVKNPRTGKPCRATLVGFLDAASRDLVGYDIMITENTQVIASALRNAIIYLGKMPKVVHLDNGRAFKGKTFTGDADFSTAGIQGLYAKLGIKTIFSKPYNGRSKIIERFFKELTESFAKLLPSYIGNNIFNQPACTKRNEKFHKQLASDYVPTIMETKLYIDKWLNEVYRQRPCNNDKALTINEYINNGRGNGVDIDLLDDLMMTSEERQVRKNGIKLFDDWYYAPELAGLNIKVIAKYDMFDLSYIKIYTTKNEFICKATRVNAVHPYAEALGSPKDLAEFKEQAKETAKQKRNLINPMNKILKSLYRTNDKKIKPIKAQEISVQEKPPEKVYKITCYENLPNICEK